MSFVSVDRTQRSSLWEGTRRTFAGRVALSIAASLFVALCAHVSVPLPFTPVPATMQTFAVILVGLTLGPAAGCGALLVYLAEGAAGLPVFSPQGVGGVAQLLGPTGGFLLSYPLVAALAGWCLRVLRQSMPALPAALVAGVIASVPIFVMGAGWLAWTMHVRSTLAVHMAVTPFLGAEVFKISAAAVAFTALRRTGKG